MSKFRKTRFIEERMMALNRENENLLGQVAEQDEKINDLWKTVTMLSYILCGRRGLTEDTKEALVKAVKYSQDTCCPASTLRGEYGCRHDCTVCWLEAAKKFKKEKSVFMVDNLRRW